jgi:Holliday junction DNA helicase RuvA
MKADSVFIFAFVCQRASRVIALLKVLGSAPTQIINVHGVGYHVMIPFKLERLSTGLLADLTHLVVREDSHVLYGFGTAGERDLFRSC